MSFFYFSTEELAENKAIIEWKVNSVLVVQSGLKNSFRLKYHPTSSFEVVCLPDIGEDINTLSSSKLILLLSSKPENTAPNTIQSEKDLSTTRLPRAVMASINGGEKFPLKHRYRDRHSSELFISDGFSVNVNQLQTQQKLLSFTISIEFYTVSRDSQQNHIKMLTDIYVSQTSCDVDFIFENNQQIGGHAAILTAISPVFAAMFQHNFKEAQTRKIHITDISFDTFKVFLHYLYAARLPGPLDEETAKQLFVAADKYNIPGLVEECVEFLVRDIRLDNALDLIAWADFHSIEKLKNIALYFISRRGLEICQLDAWNMFVKDYPDLCVIVTQEMAKQYSVKLSLFERLFLQNNV